MPDRADLEFLLNSTYCTYAWTADYNSTGVAGLVVTGNGDYAGNSIFFRPPAASMKIPFIWSEGHLLVAFAQRQC